ncbi:MAG: Xaa-Pro dipeptidase [Steroidobacteraceae bacterium]
MPGVNAPPTPAASLEESFGPHLRSVCEHTARALAASGYSALLVHSGSLVPVFEDDRFHPFEVHAPFKVWAPVSAVPDSFVWFEPGSPPRLLLHRAEDYWHKPPDPPTGYWVRHFDVRLVGDLAAARAALPASLAQAAYIGDAFAQLPAWGLKAVNPAALMRRLNYVRAAKTPYELICLREASRLGARGHVAAHAAFMAGGSEFDIELAFLKGCGLREQELPYNPIVALNAWGAVLHYQVLDKATPAQRHSLLIDAGAEFAGYASDITRTYSAGDAAFGALIGRVDGLQQALCSGVRAGVDWREVQLAAHRLTGELLRDADLSRCSADEAVATGVTRVFLPHGVGHLLGLEVHDVGGFMASPDGAERPPPPDDPHLRLTRRLEDGFVVTMEPGIYFIPQLLEAARADARGKLINWARVEGFMKFGGIRIEDDLAVTATGCENLTRQAFEAVRTA